MAQDVLDNQPPTEDEVGPGDGSVEDSGYDLTHMDGDEGLLDLSSRCRRASKDWFNAALRARVEAAWNRFNSRHPAGSKYNDPFYEKRSRLFPPKTREGLRKQEAAIAAAFFSTPDAVHCSAVNEADPNQRDAAAVHNALLYFRLVAQSQMNQGGIPWFLTLIGGSQDAMNTGVVVSRQNWEYDEREREYTDTYADGRTATSTSRDTLRDEPAVTIIPVENFHLSPSADWMAPIETSPFLIEDVPMTADEVRRRMRAKGPQGHPLYRMLPDAVIHAYCSHDWDSVQMAREGRRLDKYEQLGQVDGYRTIWVSKHIVRFEDGSDWCFDTLGDVLMLSWKPLPMEAVYLHGIRPYAMGFSVTEAHNLFPVGLNDLASQLQEQITDVTNLTLDNVKLAVNPRWKVKRGSSVDTRALMRNVPSGLVHMNNTEGDVRLLDQAQVPHAAFAEHDRLSLSMDSILGNLSQTTIGSARSLGDTVGGMNLLAADANEVKEYMVRTLGETWIEKVVRQLVMLERAYETDETVIAVAADQAGLTPQRVVQVLREGRPVLVAAAIGPGATAPVKRLERLLFALRSLRESRPDLVQMADGKEIVKEIFGSLGYKDGARFFPQLFQREKDPQIAQLEQKVQQLQQALEQDYAKRRVALEVAQLTTESKERIEQRRQQTQLVVEQYRGNIQGQMAAMKHRLDELDRMLKAEDNDLARRELWLEREALSHDIMQKDREFALAMRTQRRTEDSEDADGAMNLPGADKAGILSRGNYGALPETLGPETRTPG